MSQNLHCCLCKRHCGLKECRLGGTFAPNSCLFVSYLGFDRKIAGRVNAYGNDNIPIIFSDLLTRGKNDKVCYQDMSATDLGSSINDVVEVSVPRLRNNYPVAGADRFALQARNLRSLYPNGQVSWGEDDVALRNALLIVGSERLIYDEINSLVGFGYLTKTDNRYLFIITKAGFEANISRKNDYLDTVFIALAFKDNDDVIETIRKAVKSCGYSPVDMIHYQHNNYIMAEILKQIKECSFLVCDLSKPNYGAYFEAGYALGLGKDVILTCSKKSFDSEKLTPHFDLNQFNTTKWEDTAELGDLLQRRITDTVGVRK